jgi:hypothetical protein
MKSSKPIWIATVVAFLWLSTASFLIHQLAASADYAKMVGVFRPMAEVSMLWLNLAYVVGAVAFVQLFALAQTDASPLGQGLRFGFLASVLTNWQMYMVYFAVQPYAGQTSIKLALLDTLSYLLLGVVTAWLLRKRTP